MYREIVKKIGIGEYQSNRFEEATEHARNHKLGKQTQTWENGCFCTHNVTLRDIIQYKTAQPPSMGFFWPTKCGLRLLLSSYQATSPMLSLPE